MIKRIGVSVSLLLGVVGWAGTACADLSVGLVAFYPFNGNAMDEGGLSIHGSALGPTYTTDRFGTATSACRFDGIDDYIEVSDRVPLNGHTSLTLAVWVKTDAEFHGAGYVLSKGSGMEHQYALRIASGGFGEVVALSAPGLASMVATTKTAVNDGKWHLLVGVLRDREKAEIYLDGKLSGTGLSASWPWLLEGSAPLRLGNRFTVTGAAEFYPGVADDIRIYGRALSLAEIRQLYDEGSGPRPENCATYDSASNLLHIPCLALPEGRTFWLDLRVKGSVLEIEDWGEN